MPKSDAQSVSHRFCIEILVAYGDLVKMHKDLVQRAYTHRSESFVHASCVKILHREFVRVSSTGIFSRDLEPRACRKMLQTDLVQRPFVETSYMDHLYKSTAEIVYRDLAEIRNCTDMSLRMCFGSKGSAKITTV